MALVASTSNFSVDNLQLGASASLMVGLGGAISAIGSDPEDVLVAAENEVPP